MPRERSSAEEIAEQLRDVTVALRRRARAKSGDLRMPEAQLRVLKRLLDDGPATTADLARAEHITPQSMGAVIIALEEAGYVARREDAEDARRRLVAATAAGRKIVTVQRAATLTWLSKEIAKQLDAGEQRTVAAALILLRRLFPG